MQENYLKYQFVANCSDCDKKISKYGKSGKCKSCVNKNRRGKSNKGGWHHSEEHKKKISLLFKGRTVSAETRAKISGSNHYNWKGDSAGYNAIHTWVRSRAGTPSYCEHCKTSDKRKRYEWANVSRNYKRDMQDYIRLCASCHRQYDYKHRIAKQW
jgi:hypothetical protein